MIADRIVATQSDIAEYQALLSQRDGLLTQAEDLKNQILTAELQHQNDQATIGGLNITLQAVNNNLGKAQAALDKANADIAVLSEAIRTLKIQLAADDATIASLQAQLAALPQATYPDLEWGAWMVNTKPDAASGRGTVTLTAADNPKVPAMFSIVPDPPLPGDKDNFFNFYATQKKRPNATITNFVLTGKWDFPTDTDMKAAHCIEMEARQVMKLVAPDPLPLMAVPALQCNFSSGQLRYFNALAAGDNWIPTGIPMPRQRSIAVEMEAHRDDKTLFYDAFTINGKRYPVSFQAPLYAKTYVNERLSVSLQLDSHYLAGPFKVSPSGIALKVW